MNDLRLRRGDAAVSAFGNGICWDLPVFAETETKFEPGFEQGMEPDVPCFPDGAVLEHPFLENIVLAFRKTPSREPAYPIVKFIWSAHPEKGPASLFTGTSARSMPRNAGKTTLVGVSFSQSGDFPKKHS